jgi:hypothetical protein
MLKQKNRKRVILSIAIMSFLASCSTQNVSPKEGGYYYKNIYFGSHRSTHYKQGVQDGCSTAQGNYLKAHTLFRENRDYYDGWFLGRNRCREI